VLLVTDGVTEARNCDGVFYDPCISTLAGRTFHGPGHLVEAVVEDVTRWTKNEFRDDAAILAVTKTAHTTAGRGCDPRAVRPRETLPPGRGCVVGQPVDVPGKFAQ
jgi:hypothetical protein